MKLSKKILAAALTLALLCSCLPAAFADGPYTDNGVTIVEVSTLALNVLEVPEPSVIVSTEDEIRNAVLGAQDGDVIGIADGTYVVPRPYNFAGKKNVVLRSVSGDAAKVILSGNGFHKDDSGRREDEPIMISDGSSGITIYALTIQNSDCHGVKLSSEGNISNITIDSCRFININQRMIKGSKPVDGGSLPNLRITNNYFEDNMLPVEADHSPSFRGDYIAGMDIMGVNGGIIADNTFVNIKGANGGGRGGIFIWVSSKNVTAERNLFYGCDRGICFGNPYGEENVVGEHMKGGIIRNNVVVGSSIGIELARNEGVEVYNNTTFDCRAGIAEAAEEFNANITIKNNLINTEVRTGVAELTNNLIGETTDNYFVNASAMDFRLTPLATKAIGKGLPLTAVTEDFAGNPRAAAPSIGAFEFSMEPMSATPKTFKDIETSWSRPVVEYMADGGYILGMDEETFEPQTTITRAQFLTILMRMMDYPGTAIGNSYVDVADGKYYAEHVDTALANGILLLSDGDIFRPDDAILREEAFVWVDRAMKLDPANEAELLNFIKAFPDMDSGSWFALSTATLYVRGYVRGSDTGMNPKGNMTRAEAAQLLFNVLVKIG